MLKIAHKNVVKHQSMTGEIDSLLWQGVVFKWARNMHGFDEYEAHGYFLGLQHGKLHQHLTIVVNTVKNHYLLRVGRSVPYVKFDLLGI